MPPNIRLRARWHSRRRACRSGWRCFARRQRSVAAWRDPADCGLCPVAWQRGAPDQGRLASGFDDAVPWSSHARCTHGEAAVALMMDILVGKPVLSERDVSGAPVRPLRRSSSATLPIASTIVRSMCAVPNSSRTPSPSSGKRRRRPAGATRQRGRRERCLNPRSRCPER